MGFTQLSKSIYRRFSSERGEELIGVYVDDLCLCGNELDALLAELNAQGLTIPSYDELYYDGTGQGPAPIKYNGVQLQVVHCARDNRLFLKESMPDFLADVVQKGLGLYQKTVFKDCKTPSYKVPEETYSTPSDILEYLKTNKGISDPHSIVASILYSAKSARADLAQAVCVLTRHIGQWSKASDLLLLRLLGYIQGTYNHGLYQPWDFRNPEGIAVGAVISGVSDADLAGCILTAKSTTGLLISLELRGRNDIVADSISLGCSTGNRNYSESLPIRHPIQSC